MRVLVTGIRGFAGTHLTELLTSKKGLEVHGLGRSVPNGQFRAKAYGRVIFHPCDILNSEKLGSILKKVKPDRIFHLAAQSHVQPSWKEPALTLNTNLFGQLNLLEAARVYCPKARIHVASSSEAYGLVFPKEIPIQEAAPLRPLSPYGVSKAAQDLLAYQYYQSYKLPIVRTRAFGQAGPGQSEIPVISNFARQIALIEAKKQKPVILVGNIDAVRDFTDVRDVVRGYWMALEKGQVGDVYNICSGKGRKIRDILDWYRENCRVSVKVKKNASRMRPSDVSINIGDAGKFHVRTGWKPEITFDKMLLDILNYWRQKIGQ